MRALRFAALSLTALALLATSVRHDPACPTGTALVPGPVRLDVDTTCGPPGPVTAAVDPATCLLTLEGARGVGLPPAGRLDGASFTLSEGSRECTCDEREPGVFEARCYESRDANAIGCGGSLLPACRGTLRVAAAVP